MKPKLVGILLFICLVAPLVATFTFLHHQKASVRKELKHRIIDGVDRDELVLLKFTIAESRTKLRWKHTKEFEFAGQMYDIVEKQISGDTIYYWCWWDHEETRLNRQLDDLVAKVLGNNPQRKDRQDKTIEFLKKLYCNNSIEFAMLMKEVKLHYPAGTGQFPAIAHSPPVPPPRIG